MKSTKLRQGSNFKHIYYISANYKYMAENLFPPFSFMQKEEWREFVEKGYMENIYWYVWSICAE